MLIPSNPRITWNNAFSVKAKHKTSQIKQNSLGSHIPTPPLESYHPQQTSWRMRTQLMIGMIFIKNWQSWG